MNERRQPGASGIATDRGSSGLLLWEGIRQAGQVIGGRRLRSALLILGVSIGVATLLAIFTIVTGLSDKIREDIVSSSRPYISIARYRGLGGEDVQELLKRPQLEPELIAPIAALPGVKLVDYYVSNNEMTVLHYKEERTGVVQIIGTSQNLPYVLSLAIADGRYFSEEEVASRSRVAVLGAGPAADLFPRLDPMGKTLRIEGEAYRIVGTMESRHSFMGKLGDNFVAVPWTAFEKDFLAPEQEDRSLAAVVADGWQTEAVMADIEGVLRRERHLAPGQENDFEIVASETFGDLIDKITSGVALVLVVLSSIGLMVGGIGVMNIMLISVTERTREIGVRMALGARRRDVLFQVLVEAGTLTGIGGLIGIGLGYLASWGVTSALNFPFAISPLITLVAVLFSVSIGLVFGLYPADRAARMDPIEALRRE
jgi:putative ABC transport system permease protein